MMVRVSQKHIARGLVGSTTSCPIALAVQEQCQGKWVVWDSFVHTSNPRRSIQLPRRAQKFIMDFDGRLPVKPFTFRMPLLKRKTEWL